MTDLDNMPPPRQVALETLNAVLDPVHDGVVLLDRAGRVSLVNPAVGQRLGICESDPLPHSRGCQWSI